MNKIFYAISGFISVVFSWLVYRNRKVERKNCKLESVIDQKTKALIVVAVDVVNQSEWGPGTPFGAHVNMALKQGATREEIEEILLFMCVYGGFNKAAGCFGALNEILKAN